MLVIMISPDMFDLKTIFPLCYVISEVTFDFHSITVKRGNATLDINNFDIRNYYDILQTEFINDSDKLW